MKAQFFRLSPKRAVTVYAILFSLFIVWASLGTALGRETHHGSAIRWLGIFEIVGALLFLAQKTRSPGLILLLVVFAVASVLEWQLGLWPIRLLFYAASALFVQYLSMTLSVENSSLLKPLLSWISQARLVFSTPAFDTATARRLA